MFRHCLRAMGLIDKDFFTHSFSIEAVEEAARWGMGDETISIIGL